MLFPHQLFASVPQFVRKNSIAKVLLIEHPLFFGTDHVFPMRFHKQKLVLHRATMRAFHQELKKKRVAVEYVPFSDCAPKVLDTLIAKHKATDVHVFDLVDNELEKRVAALAKTCAVHTHDSPNFFLSAQKAKNAVHKTKRNFFHTFYQKMRTDFDVLMDRSAPIGGKWSFDHDNRKKLPKKIDLPSEPRPNTSDTVREAQRYVAKHFPKNPGSAEPFVYAVTHRSARAALKHFVKQRLTNFGPYEDAMSNRHPFLFHSVLTPMLNVGLLDPRDVVDEVLAHKNAPLASREGFVRQVLGWREYMRALYVVCGSKMRMQNTFSHTRQLTKSWYDATTGIPPLDDMITKLNAHAYAHHIERLMIAGNLMLLLRIHPDAVYTWFMELFIDAYDWVMVPNVYGMSQFADGGTIVTKPYVSSSNYILKMSDYKRGEWIDGWDGLYWQFVDRHRALFEKNPRTAMTVRMFDKLSAERKKRIFAAAKKMEKKLTAAKKKKRA